MTRTPTTPATPDGARAEPPTTGGSSFTSSQKWRGGAWSVIGFGGGQAIRFASNLIMTRLLFREAFGLMQIINALLIGLQLLTDLGLSQSVVQNVRGEDPRFRHTAWTIQILRGLILTSLALLLAGPVATFYEQEQLRPMIAACSLTILFSAFASTSLWVSQRRLNIRALAIIELSSQGCGIATCIAIAAVEPTPWAFVAGALVSSAARTVFSHLMPGWREGLCWDRAAVRALLTFGGWVFVSTLLTFLVSQTDRLVFGKMIPLGLLGVYGLAHAAAMMPAQLLTTLVDHVVYPVFCQTVHERGDLGPLFRNHRGMVGAIGGWALSGMCAGAPLIIEILYPPEYGEASWILRMLSIGMWFGVVLEKPRAAGILANGLPRLLAVSNSAKLTGMVALIPAGSWLAGFPGAVCGYAASDLCKYAMSVRNGVRMGMRDVSGDMADSALFATAVMASILATRALASMQAHFVLECLAVFVIVTMVWSWRLAPLVQRFRARSRSA